ncbi:MAG: M23 family metallopeptidase [Oscillospiraceae bacterium]|nr:M23 family metallopeptidase [Oscillospiraceae bacterium]
MKSDKVSDSKIKKFFAGKGFYMVASLCLVAVGVAAWSAVQSLPTPPIDSGKTESIVSKMTIDTSDNSAEGVGNTVSNVIDDRKTSSEPKETSSEVTMTEAPIATFFVLPITGEVIKKYNDKELQYSETYRDMRLHLGVDIAADKGTKVTAAGDGTVTEIKTDPLYGVTVIIDHGNGVTAKYCGLNGIPIVKVGDAVDCKTQLGDIDTIPCESVEQTHLHLEILKNNKTVSPLELMGMLEAE